jgi:hypothetical protein
MTSCTGPERGWRATIAVAIAAALTCAAPAAAAESPDRLHAAGYAGQHGELDPGAEPPAERLVADPVAHELAKRAAASRAPGGTAEATVAGSLAPVTTRGWLGIDDPNSAPSDSTGAVGATRYIELVNRTFGIYNKTSNTPIATGALDELTSQPGYNVFDPQVIWDPDTRRFYYVTDYIFSSTAKGLSFGWSTTATPNDPETDFCHYEFDYGSELPDYPKLGDTQHFIVIGSNVFNSANAFLRSDAVAINKPPAGQTCPAPAALDFTLETDLRSTAGPQVFTPVPANQTDRDRTGWIVAREFSLPATTFRLFRVNRGAGGAAVIQNPGPAVPIGSHTVPADAPQPGSAKVLDTLDARPTQAVSAIDPAHANQVGIWTQHTVNGAAGRSEVRWYEIDPLTRTRIQSGRIRTARFNFNAAISPDRAVNAGTASGGGAMVLGYTASSATANPQLRMVSKIGTAAQSGEVVVRTSPGPYVGFDCAGTDNSCRWGDYSGATPDPTPPVGQNRVWLVNQFASGGTSTSVANWDTWNWIATP